MRPVLKENKKEKKMLIYVSSYSYVDILNQQLLLHFSVIFFRIRKETSSTKNTILEEGNVTALSSGIRKFGFLVRPTDLTGGPHFMTVIIIGGKHKRAYVKDSINTVLKW